MLNGARLDKKHTMLNIQTFFSDVLHVPYAGDSGLQISNLFFSQAQVPSVTVKFSQKHQDSMCNNRALP